MAERQRTRRTSGADRPPVERRRASRRRRPVAEEPEPADDEMEVPEDEPEPADDELEVPEDEPEPADDELEDSEDEPEPADDELEDSEDEPEPADDEFEIAEDDGAEDAMAAESAANGGRRSRDRADSVLTARQAARAALRQIAELTPKQPEDITGIQRTDDGWAICFEVVEDHRIPSSSDILATYEATIDAEGELVSYRRTRRYARGRGDSSGG